MLRDDFDPDAVDADAFIAAANGLLPEGLRLWTVVGEQDQQDPAAASSGRDKEGGDWKTRPLTVRHRPSFQLSPPGPLCVACTTGRLELHNCWKTRTFERCARLIRMYVRAAGGPDTVGVGGDGGSGAAAGVAGVATCGARYRDRGEQAYL